MRVVRGHNGVQGGWGVLGGADLHVAHVRSEAGDGLATRAANTGEQRVATWHLQHARDAADVLDAEKEEHELHWLGRDLVVVVEIARHGLLQPDGVGHALVRLLGSLGVCERRVHQVAHVVLIDAALAVDAELLEEPGERLLEVLGAELLGLLKEPLPILAVDEAVVEDAEELVRPQQDEVARLLEVVLVGEQHTLHHAREVA